MKQRGNFTLHQKTPRLLLHAPPTSPDKKFSRSTVQGKRSSQNVTVLDKFVEMRDFKLKINDFWYLKVFFFWQIHSKKKKNKIPVS